MIFKRTSIEYTRNTPNCKWKECGTHVDYCGESWARKMTGPEDVKFFNSLSWARGGEIRYSNNRFFTSIAPDKLTKVYDLFEPVDIPWSIMGHREWEALNYATCHMRCTDSEDHNGHELLTIPYLTEDGDERTVTYDLTNKKFVA
jgi:hypothetical protein